MENPKFQIGDKVRIKYNMKKTNYEGTYERKKGKEGIILGYTSNNNYHHYYIKFEDNSRYYADTEMLELVETKTDLKSWDDFFNEYEPVDYEKWFETADCARIQFYNDKDIHDYYFKRKSKILSQETKSEVETVSFRHDKSPDTFIDLKDYKETNNTSYAQFPLERICFWDKNHVQHFYIKKVKTPIKIDSNNKYYLIYKTGNVELIKTTRIGITVLEDAEPVFIPKEDIIKLYEEIKKL